MRKNIIRIVALVLAAFFILGTIGSIFVFAGSPSLDEGVYAYGAGLTQQQIDETRILLEEDADVYSVAITGADSLKYIGEDNSDAAMKSSIYAQTNGDDGIDIEILTPLTIQDVTAVQYTNAAITAGLDNVEIKVASAIPVTGTSALTGVYKLVEMAGQELDTDRTKAANEEIQVINAISKEHADNPEFSKEKLNQVVIEVKENLVQIKEENGNVNGDQINTVINNVIRDNNLEQIITTNNIENLQVLFENFINIENLNLSVVKEQLQELLDDAPKMAAEELNKIKDFFNTQEGKNFLDSINTTFSKENIEEVLSGARNAIDSPEVDNILNQIKDSVDSENIDNIVEGAKESLGVDSEAINGIWDSIVKFFNDIVDAIKNLFS